MPRPGKNRLSGRLPACSIHFWANYPYIWTDRGESGETILESMGTAKGADA